MKEIEEKPVEHEFSKDFLTGCLALIRFETERLGCCPNRARCSLGNIYRVFWPNYKYITTEMVKVAQRKNTVASSQ
jgi:hypothetical protein